MGGDQGIMFGYKKKTPVLPICGWMGDIMLKKLGNMAWWKGAKVIVDAEEFHVDTLHDVLSLEEFHVDISYDVSSPGFFSMKGDGGALAGRVEHGIVKQGEETIFLPTHTHQKFFTVQTHHHLDGNSFGEEFDRRVQEW